MEINGNIIENLDIKLYQGIALLACNQILKKDQKPIPSFIVEEALTYYSELERYETCQKIKSYFDKNIKILINSSRKDWYGR